MKWHKMLSVIFCFSGLALAQNSQERISGRFRVEDIRGEKNLYHIVIVPIIPLSPKGKGETYIFDSVRIPSVLQKNQEFDGDLFILENKTVKQILVQVLSNEGNRPLVLLSAQNPVWDLDKVSLLKLHDPKSDYQFY